MQKAGPIGSNEKLVVIKLYIQESWNAKGHGRQKKEVFKMR